MRTGPNIRKRIDGRFEARYEKGRNETGRIIYGCCYGKTYEEAESKRAAILGVEPSKKTRPHVVRRMNLLILGAGGQSYVVQEVAQSIGVFNKIAFLDDDPENKRAISNCEDCARFIDEYPIAIPSVGDGELRMRWIKMLESAGFIMPTLISPSATVSPSAEIGYATLIEPKATIGANAKIGNGCIISSGAIIDRDVVISDWTHIDCGVAVRKE